MVYMRLSPVKVVMHLGRPWTCIPRNRNSDKIDPGPVQPIGRDPSLAWPRVAARESARQPKVLLAQDGIQTLRYRTSGFPNQVPYSMG